MSVIIRQLRKSVEEEQIASGVIDQPAQEIAPVTLQEAPDEDQEGFVEGFIKSFTEPVTESIKDINIAASSGSRARSFEAQRKLLDKEATGLLELKTGPNALPPEEFKTQLNELYSRQQRFGKGVEAFTEELDSFTTEKVLRDFGSLALIATSFGVGGIAAAGGRAIFATRFPALAKIAANAARGGAITSPLLTADAVREGKELEEIFQAAGIGFVSGAALGAATPFLPKAFKFGGKGIGKVVVKTEERFPEVKALRQFLFSRTINRIENNFGKAGKEFADLYRTSSREGRKIASDWEIKLQEVGLVRVPKLVPFRKDVIKPLTDREAWSGPASVVDLLEGRVSVNDPRVTKRVLSAFNVADANRQYMEQVSKRAIAGFRSRKNYFAHYVPDVGKVRKGDLRDRILQNMVYKLKEFRTLELAEGFMDDWIAWVDAGGRIKGGNASNKFIQWIMKKQRVSRDEAQRIADVNFLTKKGKDKILPKFGSLERGRDLDFPVFEPDARVVLPMYTYEGVARTQLGLAFGKGEDKLNKWILSISRDERISPAKRDAAGRELEGLFRTIFKTSEVGGATQRTQGLARGLRTVSTPLLTFAQIINVGQSSTNIPLAADFPALFYGLRQAFRQEGVVEALRTGSVLSRVISDSMYYSGGSTQFASSFLRATGFGWTELFNRTVATHAGMRYFEQTALRLGKNPESKLFRRQIAELGGNVDDIILRKGKVTKDEVLIAGQVFSEKTQFLNDPASLPAWASSEWGKVMFQFKNFAFNQSILVKEEFNKRPIRTTLMLGTIFPMTTEVLTDIRSLVTQEKKPTKFLDRYLWNIMRGGAFGLALDILTSAQYRSLLEAGVGPGISGVAQIGEEAVRSVYGADIEPLLKASLRRTGVGRVPVNVFYPPREGKSSLEALGNLFQ